MTRASASTASVLTLKEKQDHIQPPPAMNFSNAVVTVYPFSAANSLKLAYN
jgi:hypothetical protein